MNRNVSRLFLPGLLLGAVLLAPVLCAASADQKAPDGAKVGRARLVAPVEGAKTGEIRVPVTIDLSAVQIDGRAAVLGAYVVSLRFDATRVAYVGVARGAAPEFTEAPSATPVEKANSLGIVKIVGDQALENAPTGAVSVAVVTFRELVPGGGASIKPSIDSLASSLRKDRQGRILTDLKIPVEPQE